MRLSSSHVALKPVGSAIPWQKTLINDFSFGMNTYHQEDGLPEGQFRDVTNLIIRRDGKLQMRSRYRPILTGTGNTSDNSSTFDNSSQPSFFWIDDSRYLASWFTDSDRALEAWDSSTGVWDTIDNTWASSDDITAISFAINDTEDLILANGTDGPLRWDGDPDNVCTALGLDLVLVSAATNGTNASTSVSVFDAIATAAQDADDRGLDFDGTYYYKATYEYSSATTTKFGESGPSINKLSVAVSGTASAPQYVTIDIGTGVITGDVEKVKMYRSPPDNILGPYRYVGEFDTDNSQWKDVTPVGSETIEIPADAGTPPNLKYLMNHAGRVLAFDGDLTNKIVYSEAGQPDFFPALNYHYLPTAGKGWGTFNRNLYVFTENQTFVFPDSDVTRTPVKICDRGCAAPKSVVDVGTGLMWVGPESVYWADFNTQAVDGDYPIAVGEPIKDHIDNVSDFDKVTACLHEDTYYLSLGFDTQNNNTTLTFNVPLGVHHMRSGRYSGWTRLGFPAGHIWNNAGTLYHSDINGGYVYEHGNYSYDYTTFSSYIPGNTPAEDANIKAVDIRLATGLADFGEIFADKMIKAVHIQSRVPFATFKVSATYDSDFLKSQNIQVGSNPELRIGARYNKAFFPKHNGTAGGHTNTTTFDLDAGGYNLSDVNYSDSHARIDILWVQDDLGGNFLWGDIPVENVWEITAIDDGADTVTVDAFAGTHGTTEVWLIGPSICVYGDLQDISRVAKKKIPLGKGKQVKLVLSCNDARSMDISAITIIYKVLPHSF